MQIAHRIPHDSTEFNFPCQVYEVDNHTLRIFCQIMVLTNVHSCRVYTNEEEPNYKLSADYTRMARHETISERLDWQSAIEERAIV